MNERCVVFPTSCNLACRYDLWPPFCPSPFRLPPPPHFFCCDQYFAVLFLFRVVWYSGNWTRRLAALSFVKFWVQASFIFRDHVILRKNIMLNTVHCVGHMAYRKLYPSATHYCPSVLLDGASGSWQNLCSANLGWHRHARGTLANKDYECSCNRL